MSTIHSGARYKGKSALTAPLSGLVLVTPSFVAILAIASVFYKMVLAPRTLQIKVLTMLNQWTSVSLTESKLFGVRPAYSMVAARLAGS